MSNRWHRDAAPVEADLILTWPSALAALSEGFCPAGDRLTSMVPDGATLDGLLLSWTRCRLHRVQWVRWADGTVWRVPDEWAERWNVLASVEQMVDMPTADPDDLDVYRALLREIG